MVFKTLITIGATFWNGSERDINKTYYYLKEYIEKEFYNLVED